MSQPQVSWPGIGSATQSLAKLIWLAGFAPHSAGSAPEDKAQPAFASDSSATSYFGFLAEMIAQNLPWWISFADLERQHSEISFHFESEPKGVSGFPSSFAFGF